MNNTWLTVLSIIGIVVGIALVLAGIDGSFSVWGCIPPSGVNCIGAAPWLYVYAVDLFIAGIVFMVVCFGGFAYSLRKRRDASL